MREGGRVDEGNERGRDGTRHGQREGGSEQGTVIQGRYPEEDTGQYTVYSQTIPQRGPFNWYFVITNEK